MHNKMGNDWNHSNLVRSAQYKCKFGHISASYNFGYEIIPVKYPLLHLYALFFFTFDQLLTINKSLILSFSFFLVCCSFHSFGFSFQNSILGKRTKSFIVRYCSWKIVVKKIYRMFMFVISFRFLIGCSQDIKFNKIRLFTGIGKILLSLLDFAKIYVICNREAEIHLSSAGGGG